MVVGSREREAWRGVRTMRQRCDVFVLSALADTAAPSLAETLRSRGEVEVSFSLVCLSLFVWDSTETWCAPLRGIHHI